MASRGVNKVILIGNLGQDPEVRYMPNGSAVANFSVATSESWKDKQTSENRDRTEWHRVTVFGKLAEIVGEYTRKGTRVYLEGQLQTHKWQDQGGNDRYTTEVVVNSLGGAIQILSSRNGNDNFDDNSQNRGQSDNNISVPVTAPETEKMDFDDDISF